VIPDANDIASCQRFIRHLADTRHVRISRHAQEEMDAELFDQRDVLGVLQTGNLLENYPTHQRGACCLMEGKAIDGRPLHVVCTTLHQPLIVITVYEPHPPKWNTPTQRSR
jgi:hypothetical protein